MVKMLLYNGLRPSDIIDLTVEQVDIKKMLIKYRSPKVDRWYYRPIHPKVRGALRERIKEVQAGRLFEYTEVGNMSKVFRRYLKEL